MLSVAEPPLADGAAITTLRRLEFQRLDDADVAYLDYTGAGLHADRQIVRHLADLRRDVLGNPHSESEPSLAATTRRQRRCARAAPAAVNTASDRAGHRCDPAGYLATDLTRSAGPPAGCRADPAATRESAPRAAGAAPRRGWRGSPGSRRGRRAWSRAMPGAMRCCWSSSRRPWSSGPRSSRLS